jgi:hypothetical protein
MNFSPVHHLIKKQKKKSIPQQMGLENKEEEKRKPRSSTSLEETPSTIAPPLNTISLALYTFLPPSPLYPLA